MARAKRTRSAATPPSGDISLSPIQLRPGDRWTDEAGIAWEVFANPTSLKKGKTIRVHLRRVDNPTLEDIRYWPEGQRMTVRRPNP